MIVIRLDGLYGELREDSVTLRAYSESSAIFLQEAED